MSAPDIGCISRVILVVTSLFSFRSSAFFSLSLSLPLSLVQVGLVGECFFVFPLFRRTSSFSWYCRLLPSNYLQFSLTQQWEVLSEEFFLVLKRGVNHLWTKVKKKKIHFGKEIFSLLYFVLIPEKWKHRKKM